MYDAVVVGAGVAGCAVAHALHQKGLKICIVDRTDEIASGGSGAAGAFVSPKIGKASSLHSLTNEAFAFAVEFYQTHFPQYFHQTGVIRIPKDDGDNQNFALYREFNYPNFKDIKATTIESLGIQSPYDGFLFEEGGVVDAKEMCAALIEGVKFGSIEICKIEQKGSDWRLNGVIGCRYLILATGYQNELIDIEYMGISGVWGCRGDFKSSLTVGKSIHQDLSISQNIEGIIKIGATHSRHASHPLLPNPLEPLIQKASRLIDTTQLELVEVFCGLRSGSKDYTPLVGGVVDSAYMLQNYPQIQKGAKASLKRVENLFVINGLGGRGFVLAPLMAKLLAEHIVEGKAIDSRIDPDRLFLKWARRL